MDAREQAFADRAWAVTLVEPEPAYGLWLLVFVNAAVFILFALSFATPRSARDWRSFGAFSAFLIALFTEMYGFPLTIYLLSGWLGSRYPGIDFLSHDAGHLLEMLFGWQANPHFGPFHVASYLLIFIGFVLLAKSWGVLYVAQQRRELATSGPYGWVRHPQYLGFILIMFGFLLQWPTLVTLAMFPVLVYMYVRLARREEREAGAEFGEEFASYAKRTPGFLPLPGASFARLLPVVMLVFVAFVAAPASAAEPVARVPGEAKPRFAGLQVDLWPEYDRRDAVLVIMKAELAPDVALPATVSLRVPGSSEVTAVAFATAPDSQLFNLAFDRTQAGAVSILQFKTSQRLLHVEFYDRLGLDAGNRRFTYVWPGDLAVDRLTVRLQEPAAASDVQAKPELGPGARGADALVYRTAEFGAFDAGRRLPIEIGYAKSDLRTSLEILESGKASAQPVASSSSDARTDWLLLAVAAVALLLAMAAMFLFWRARRSIPAASPRAAVFCKRCGNGVDAEDRFCAKCGAPTRKGEKPIAPQSGPAR